MKTDVIVIGSGQAGVPLATRLAEAGRRVVIAERKKLGGTCVNYGCTPTKTMVASAHAAHVARTAARFGVKAGPVKIDMAAVVDRKDRIVRQWREGVKKRLQRTAPRLTLVRGHARFIGPRLVEIAGERYEADVVIINVGARPAVPPIAGLDDVPWLDNSRIMQLRRVPDHLIVLGGGYIGCEFAQMFRRFGAKVTVADRDERLLSTEEPEASAALEGAFRAEGIRLESRATAKAVSAGTRAVTVRFESGKKVTGSHLLVAVGRRPNTDDLGAEAGGIRLDAKGYIEVDERYRTSADGVYAVGDCTPGPQFTHASWDDHRILFEWLQGRGTRTRKDRLVPITAFTDPQVARIGLTERDARARGRVPETATMRFGRIARAVETDQTAGTMKILLDAKTEQVLGVSIVGAEAGELIHIFAPVMVAGLSARALVDAEYVHPTFAEGVQSLVMSLGRYAIE
ncbi:MAG: pyridine nucleotide-disulfide oxidoreductase [Acidobacteria bacterium]|nr:MAG: pyridine nucleotide-disulfide oxidoreductase [Acidobacteriota bacterium]